MIFFTQPLLITKINLMNADNTTFNILTFSPGCQLLFKNNDYAETLTSGKMRYISANIEVSPNNTLIINDKSADLGSELYIIINGIDTADSDINNDRKGPTDDMPELITNIVNISYDPEAVKVLSECNYDMCCGQYNYVGAIFQVLDTYDKPTIIELKITDGMYNAKTFKKYLLCNKGHVSVVDSREVDRKILADLFNVDLKKLSHSI